MRRLPLVLALMAIGCGGGSSNGCGNTATIVAVNNGTQIDSVQINGTSVGTINPGAQQTFTEPSGAAYTVAFFHASDGSVACNPLTTATLGDCIQDTLTCSN